MRTTASYGTGHSNGPCYLTFKGNSVVNTDNKDKTADDGGANRGTGSTYVVLGGSYLVNYDPSFNHDVTTPTNGKDNGDEWLGYFTLVDSNINELKPININGDSYTYPVEKPSKDGKKHVFVPEAKVVFSLNNGNASFADGTNKDKTARTIRGYKLDTVEGNNKPGTPKDKNDVKFLGWFYKDKSGTEKEFDWNAVQKENINVYAKWDAKTVVYHNANDYKYIESIGADDTEANVLDNADVIKADAKFEIKGKTFKYWTTDVAGKGKQYKPGDKITFNDDTKNFDLYAQYDKNLYTVKFSANGGSFAYDSIFKTNADVFKIEKDENGGEVAVLIKQAEYGQKLHDLLGSADYNKLLPVAKKLGYIVADQENWFNNSDGSGSGIRFFDKTFLITFPGKNPEITTDTTYYIKWKPDPSIYTTKLENINLPADIYGKDANKSKEVQIVRNGNKVNLTGAVDISSIKAQMVGIEGRFGVGEDKFSEIKISDPKSTFTATFKMPNGITIPDSPKVEAKGLGDCFDIEKATKNGQNLTISFKLKPGIDNYKKLKDAVESAGILPEDRSPSSWITLTVKDLTIEDKAPQELTVLGEVNGDFSAVAAMNDKVERFDFTWKGSQAAEGKDVKATDDSTIQYSLNVSKPMELSLDGDILVKEKNGYNTEHESIYPVEKGDKIDYAGRLDVSSIQDKIKLLSDTYGGIEKSKNYDLENVDSVFTAKFTLDEGLDISAVKLDNITLTGNDLFEIDRENSTIDGNTVTVKMVLKNKNYKKFGDLYNDVTGVSSSLEVVVPDVKVSTETTDTKLKVTGDVEGTFYGEAISSSGKKEAFNFKWKAVQSDDGRDLELFGDDTKKGLIQLTVTLTEPLQLELEGDILIGEDTQHTHVYPAEKGDSLTYTGRLDVSPIKEQIDSIKNGYTGGKDNEIVTEKVASSFEAVFTLPDGLSIDESEKDNIVLTDNNLFKIDKENTKIDGNKVTVKMVLKKNYDKFIDLCDDVKSVPYKLDVNVPGVTVDEENLDGTKLTTEGTVNGKFFGKAKLGEKIKVFNFAWSAKQVDYGRDSTQPLDKENKDKIKFTIQLPTKLELEGELKGDLLVQEDGKPEDSEDKAVHITQGKDETFIGRLFVDPIVEQIKLLKENYGRDTSKIKTEKIKSEFVTTLTLPAEMEVISEKLNAELTGTKAFKIKSTEIKDGKIIITLDLVKDYKMFDDLYEDIASIKEPLNINLTGLKVRKGTEPDKNFTLNGTVTGTFTGKAITESGSSQLYNFKWNAVQHEVGKDFIQDKDDNSINLTMKLKRESVNPPSQDEGNNKPNNPPSANDSNGNKKPNNAVEKKNNSPSTGDITRILVYILIAGISLLAILALIAYKKKNNK